VTGDLGNLCRYLFGFLWILSLKSMAYWKNFPEMKIGLGD
jgi:hypothetical protein